MEQSHKPTDRLWYSILQFLLTVQQLWLKNLKNDLSVLKSSCQSIYLGLSFLEHATGNVAPAAELEESPGKAC